MKLNYALKPQEYTWKNTLYGNFTGHCKLACSSNVAFGHRFVHGLIAFAEIPVIGLISSIFETAIVKTCMSKKDKKTVTEKSASNSITKTPEPEFLDIDLTPYDKKTFNFSPKSLTPKKNESPETQKLISYKTAKQLLDNYPELRDLEHQRGKNCWLLDL